MTYTVDLQFHGHVKFTVEADDKENAENKAYIKLDNSDGWDVLEKALWNTYDVSEVKYDE